MPRAPKIPLTSEQKRRLTRLWTIYGNYGRRHSNADHHFIQQFLEQGQDTRNFYQPSEECVERVDAILKLGEDSAPG